MISGVVAVLVLGMALAAQGAEVVDFEHGFPKTTKHALYPLSEIKRGDRGIGYTVLREDKVSPFEVEVLGVMKGMLGPGQDVILARLTGSEIEFTGVVSGMSGSPVYIGGRLVGAVAYRFGVFSKEPIAGITPIQGMLEIGRRQWALPLPKAVDRHSFSGVDLNEWRARRVEPLPVRWGSRSIRQEEDQRLQPIETPLMVAGLDPKSRAYLYERLTEAGFRLGSTLGGAGVMPMPTGIAKNAPAAAGGVRAAPIAPASPIAAVLMRGDISIAAIGTVTFVEGKDVYAFGHPFLGTGRVKIPMATASILNTLATPAGSYKQGTPALNVGAITHDRLTAIAGRLGDVAPMVPVSVRVGVASDTQSVAPRTTKVEIVKSLAWLSPLLESAVLGAAARRLGYEGGGTIDFRARLHVGERTLAFTDSYSSPAPTNVASLVARDLRNTVSVIAKNVVGEPDFRGIEMELDVSPDVAISRLEEVVPDRARVRPGDQLGFTIFLRRYRGERRPVRMALQVPEDAEGTMSLFVGGGVDMDRRDARVLGRRYPKNLDALLGVLADRRSARSIHAGLYLKRPGLRVGTEVYSSLPPSMRTALHKHGGKASQALTEAFGPSKEIPWPDVVRGAFAIPVEVSKW